MSLLLDALLVDGSLEKTIEANGEALHRMMSRKNVRTFKVTRDHGYIAMQLYPEAADEEAQAQPAA